MKTTPYQKTQLKLRMRMLLALLLASAFGFMIPWITPVVAGATNNSSEEIHHSNPVSLGPAPIVSEEKLSSDSSSELFAIQNTEEMRTELENLINEYREEQGMAPLSIHSCTREAADVHAIDLADNQMCSHTGSDGSNPATRMFRAGCGLPYGEIVACGLSTAEAVLQGFIDSPQHRSIMLCANCVSFGAGYAETTTHMRNYWVVNFTKDASTPAPTATTQPPSPTPTATSVPPTASPTSVPMTMGDVDCDTSRNVIDALYVLQHDAGLRDSGAACEQERVYETTCDVNTDENCNVVDALLILQCDVGNTNPLCPEGGGPAGINPLLEFGRTDSMNIDAGDITDLRGKRGRAKHSSGNLQFGRATKDIDGQWNVPLELDLHDARKVGALSLIVQYDTTQYSIDACDTNSQQVGLCNDGGEGLLRMSLTATEGLAENSPIATLKVRSNEEGGTWNQRAFRMMVDTAGSTEGKPLRLEVRDSKGRMQR